MPMMGHSFFSANVGGAMAVIGSLIGHVVYGALRGSIYRRTPKERLARAA
jgi:hypothetical protein